MCLATETEAQFHTHIKRILCMNYVYRFSFTVTVICLYSVAMNTFVCVCCCCCCATGERMDGQRKLFGTTTAAATTKDEGKIITSECADATVVVFQSSPLHRFCLEYFLCFSHSLFFYFLPHVEAPTKHSYERHPSPSRE